MRYYYKSKTGNNYFNLASCLSTKEQDDYIEITEEEFLQATNPIITAPNELDLSRNNKLLQISELKKLLFDTDYQAIKYAEGLLTAEEYEPVKQQRQAWRDQINQLEASLNNEE